MGRSQTYPVLTDLIGNTPLVDCSWMLAGLRGTVLFKLEKFNITGSVKDRAALHIVNEAERTGRLAPGGTIIESSSGNLGMSLAFLGALRGYRVIIIVDPKACAHSIAVMKAYGAEVLMLSESGANGNSHLARVARARELEQTIPGAFWINQTANPVNARAHRVTTGVEIMRAVDGYLDACVLAVSSSGQISGVAETVKEECPDARIIGVDAKGSAVFGSEYRAYQTQGIGLGWRPAILRDELIDDVFLLDHEACISACRYLARRGLLVGPSSGAVALVSFHLGLRSKDGGIIVGVLPDGGEKYLESVASSEIPDQPPPAPSERDFANFAGRLKPARWRNRYPHDVRLCLPATAVSADETGDFTSEISVPTHSSSSDE